MSLDITDPYLERNLARLESRFKGRLQASIDKDQKRRQNGKSSHVSTLKSIAENRERLEKVRLLQRNLLAKQKARASNFEA